MFIDFNRQGGPGSILTYLCVSLLNRIAQMQVMVEPGLLSTDNHFTVLYTILRWFGIYTTRKDAAGVCLRKFGE